MSTTKASRPKKVGYDFTFPLDIALLDQAIERKIVGRGSSSLWDQIADSIKNDTSLNASNITRTHLASRYQLLSNAYADRDNSEVNAPIFDNCDSKQAEDKLKMLAKLFALKDAPKSSTKKKADDKKADDKDVEPKEKETKAKKTSKKDDKEAEKPVEKPVAEKVVAEKKTAKPKTKKTDETPATPVTAPVAAPVAETPVVVPDVVATPIKRKSVEKPETPAPNADEEEPPKKKRKTASEKAAELEELMNIKIEEGKALALTDLYTASVDTTDTNFPAFKFIREIILEREKFEFEKYKFEKEMELAHAKLALEIKRLEFSHNLQN